MTFSQILSFSQTLFLISLYRLLLSLSQILKQTPLKSSLKGVTILVPLRLHVIYGSRFKQPSSSVYLTQRLRKYLTSQTTRLSTLGTTGLYHKREVKLITSGFTLLKKEELKKWLLASPSHRHVAYYKMARHLPQLHAKEKAFRTAV